MPTLSWYIGSDRLSTQSSADKGCQRTVLANQPEGWAKTYITDTALAKSEVTHLFALSTLYSRLVRIVV